jgi:hypothetical protein
MSIVFGDSFISVFTLIKDVKVEKFSGKSIVGLVKNNDKDRKKIISLANKNNNKCLLFWFGNVDLCFVFYNKLVYKNELIDFKSLVKEYVKFIDGINTKKEKIIIVPSYPRWETKKEIISGLLNYGSVIAQDIQKTQEKYFSRKILLENYYTIKKTLIIECKKYNIKLIDLEPYIINKKQKK